MQCICYGGCNPDHNHKNIIFTGDVLSVKHALIYAILCNFKLTTIYINVQSFQNDDNY